MTDRGSDVKFSSTHQDEVRRTVKARKRRRNGAQSPVATDEYPGSLTEHLDASAAQAYRDQVIAGLTQQTDLAMMHCEVEAHPKDTIGGQVIWTAMVEFALVIPAKGEKRTDLAIDYALREISEEERSSQEVRDAVRAVRNSLRWAYSFLRELGLRDAA